MANHFEGLSGVLQNVLGNYFEHLSGVLQSFGAAGIALLVVPVVITLLARDVARALYTSLLSLAAFMLLVPPASAVSALAILSGLGSFVVASESIVARRRRVALNKETVGLATRLNRLETAEKMRFEREVFGPKKGRRKSQPKPSSASTDTAAGRSTSSHH